MKTQFKLKAAVFAGLGIALGLADLSAQTPRNLIIQRDLATNIRRDIVTTNSSGSQTALLPIGLSGSQFQLFAEGNGNDTNVYFLDQKVVGAYQPEGELTLQSQDPYPTLRTRADIPFSYTVRVSGLSDDASAHEAARNVLFDHKGQNYNSQTYAGGNNTVYPINSYNMGNSEITHGPVYSELIGFTDPTIKMGEERFTLSSYPDLEVPSFSILASEKIQVWPVAQATIAGFTDGQLITGTMPTFTVQYEDSYPKSNTYVQVYKGSPALGTDGTPVPGTVRVHDSVVPQNDTVTVTADRLEPLLGTGGIYTIEILTVTPFNNGVPERLAHLTFEIQRGVEVRGQVITSEN